MMKKQFMAILAALIMTAGIAAFLLVIGGAALVNKNGTVVSNSPSQAAANTSLDGSSQDQVAQLQNLIAQYQDREQQYQQREAQLEEQLSQANGQIQQDQQMIQQVQLLLNALRQRGLITVTEDGRVIINR